MKQQSLRFDCLSQGHSAPRTRRDYDADNLRCARIILADRARWQAQCALLVRWAERVIERLGAKHAA